MSKTAIQFVEAAENSGISLVAGVPCSYLAPLISEFSRSRIPFWNSTREDNACSTAAGAYLAGGKPLVFMQNSGFAQALNTICSLLIPYRIPLVIVVSWRGEPGTDSEEHTALGKALPKIVDSIGLHQIELAKLGPVDALKQATECSLNARMPVVLLTRRGDFA